MNTIERETEFLIQDMINDKVKNTPKEIRELVIYQFYLDQFNKLGYDEQEDLISKQKWGGKQYE